MFTDIAMVTNAPLLDFVTDGSNFTAEGTLDPEIKKVLPAKLKEFGITDTNAIFNLGNVMSLGSTPLRKR